MSKLSASISVSRYTQRFEDQVEDTLFDFDFPVESSAASSLYSLTSSSSSTTLALDHQFNCENDLMGNNKTPKRGAPPALDHEEDSGLDCDSNLSPPPRKAAKLDDEVMLLKALIKEVGDPGVDTKPDLENLRVSLRWDSIDMLAGNFPSKSRNGKYELTIISQPEEQHRARYLTEGSRGSIKDSTGVGHPIVRLYGPNTCVVPLDCFIGHDKHVGLPHLFYQASKISGKNSTRCSTSKIDGTTVVSMDIHPDQDMQVTVDCIGILKERNVDVEQRLVRLKSKSGMGANGTGAAIPNKKRSTRCRMVFRCHVPGSGEVLQVVSNPILCTQPLGTPEICKKSLFESDVKGGSEMFIIGKNFLKDSKVVWKSTNWTKIVDPDKEYLHSTHLVCNVPPYEGPDLGVKSSIQVTISVRSGGKYSDSVVFTYTNSSQAVSFGASLQVGSTPASLNDSLVLQKPLLLTMTGQAADRSGPTAALEHKSQSPETGGPLRGFSFPSNPDLVECQTVSMPGVSEDSMMSNESTATSEYIYTSEESFVKSQVFSESSSYSVDGHTDYGCFASALVSENSATQYCFPSELVSRHSTSSTLLSENNHTFSNISTLSALPPHSHPLSFSQSQPQLPNLSFSIEAMSATPSLFFPTDVSNCQALPPLLPPQSVHSLSLPSDEFIVAASEATSSELMPPPPVPSLPTHPTLSSPVADAVPDLVPPPLSDAQTQSQPQSIPLQSQTTLTSSSASFPSGAPSSSANPTISQATQICTMSQMTDTELLRLINPSTFDQCV